MRTKLVAFVLILLGAIACSNQLTRPKAEQLINDRPDFASTSKIALTESGIKRDGLDAGALEGLWILKSGRRQLTEKGGQFFADTTGALVHPATRRVVEVTGIADVPGAQNLKEVDFTWKYKDLPDVVERYTGQSATPDTGEAVMQLFDDGWRVQQLNFQESSRAPFQWTDSLMKQLEAEKLSRRPTKTLASHRLGWAEFVMGSGRVTFIDLTDATVKVRLLDLRSGFDQWYRDGNGPRGIFAVNSDTQIGLYDLADVTDCSINPTSIGAPAYSVTLETTKETLTMQHNAGENQGAVVKAVCDDVLRARDAWRAKWRH